LLYVVHLYWLKLCLAQRIIRSRTFASRIALAIRCIMASSSANKLSYQTTAWLDGVPPSDLATYGPTLLFPAAASAQQAIPGAQAREALPDPAEQAHQDHPHQDQHSERDPAAYTRNMGVYDALGGFHDKHANCWVIVLGNDTVLSYDPGSEQGKRLRQTSGEFWRIGMVHGKPCFRQAPAFNANDSHPQGLFLWHSPLDGLEGWYISDTLFCDQQGMLDVNPHAWVDMYSNARDCVHFPFNAKRPLVACTIMPVHLADKRRYAQDLEQHEFAANTALMASKGAYAKGTFAKGDGKGQAKGDTTRGGWMQKTASVSAAAYLGEHDVAVRRVENLADHNVFRQALIDETRLLATSIGLRRVPPAADAHPYAMPRYSR
jgi:hypothetical protein